MKKLYAFLPAIAFVLAGCNDNLEFEAQQPETTPQTSILYSGFPEADNSTDLSNMGLCEKSANLLRYVDPITATDTLGRANITAAQYAEIKAFTDELVAGITDHHAILDLCCTWVNKNVEYAHSHIYPDGSGVVNNDPYPVFKTRYAICQGYANLLFIMMHSQGIPAFVTNGILNPLGGHAWNYVYTGKNWYVADPTNSTSLVSYRLFGSYAHLLPYSFDIVLYSDAHCSYDYRERSLNICRINDGNDIFTVPYSVQGFKIESLNPAEPIPANIKQLYVGSNIVSFGEENNLGLKKYAPNLEYIHIDPANKKFISNLGIVYSKNGANQALHLIPSGMKTVELMPIEVIYKNTIYDHPGVEAIIFAPGTKRIDDWAIENCPKLKVAYVPEDVEVASSAFGTLGRDVHSDFQIIRGDYTNIPQIKAD